MNRVLALTIGEIKQQLQAEFPGLRTKHVQYAVRVAKVEPTRMAGTYNLYQAGDVRLIREALRKIRKKKPQGPSVSVAGLCGTLGEFIKLTEEAKDLICNPPRMDAPSLFEDILDFLREKTCKECPREPSIEPQEWERAVRSMAREIYCIFDLDYCRAVHDYGAKLKALGGKLLAIADSPEDEVIARFDEETFSQRQALIQSLVAYLEEDCVLSGEAAEPVGLIYDKLVDWYRGVEQGAALVDEETFTKN